VTCDSVSQHKAEKRAKTFLSQPQNVTAKSNVCYIQKQLVHICLKLDVYTNSNSQVKLHLNNK